MTTEDRNDILKFYIDAVYEHLKHSELRDRLRRNADEDRVAEEVAIELFWLAQGKFNERLDALEREAELETANA